ncbi:MAG TPA: cation diffusion facilitator family transporter [Gaiella sp.]|jgi:cobalt-zinc-cadmium efflux system protein
MSETPGAGRRLPHGHEGHAHDHREAGARALLVVLALTTAYTVAEVVAGWLTGSLALLADAGHMLSDDLSIGLALLAIWLARRPATHRRSFGFKRAEILAAFLNGLALVLVSIWIVVEAVGRLSDPPEVLGGWMLAVALGGVAVNVLAFAILLRSARESLNVEAAFRHVVADLLASVGVVVAAVVILVTGWTKVDPLVSLAIAVLVLWSAWAVLRDSSQILLEATPSGVDAREVERAIVAVPGVHSVHDLHIWTITSGFDALSAHVLVARGDDCHARRLEIERMLARRFGIDHTTLQVDHAAGELIQIERG